MKGSILYLKKERILHQNLPEMKLILIFCLVFFIISQESDGQPHGKIHVKIQGIEHENGTLYVGLFTEDDKFLKEATWNKSMIVGNEKTFQVSFENIPLGTYAVSVYHDLDDNGQLDTNFIGIPSEPVGFSNDHQPKMGPPKFKGAKFSLSGNEMDLTVNMYTY
jgi:uncharacterized protein (DUF2141 family)